MNTRRFCKLLLSVFALSLSFASCNDGEETNSWIVSEVVSDGVIIVNEGSYYSNVDGSLDFLSFEDNQMHRNLFKQANGRSLGGTPNGAVGLTVGNGSYLYVACTDENRVEVTDATSLLFNSKTQISVPSPRELAAGPEETFIYVSSYDGKVRKINALTNEVVKTSEKIGDNLEGIVALNGFVYVCDSYAPLSEYPYADYHTNVVKLRASDLSFVKNITVAANPNVLKSDGENVYVACWGNYGDIPATVQAIDKADEVKTLSHANLMTLCDDKLYLVNTTYDENRSTTYTYTVYDLKTNTETKLIDGSEVFSPVQIGVDPITGEVFISSYNKNADTGYVDYAADGYLVRYSKNGQFINKYTVGVGPATMLFCTHRHTYVETDPSKLPQ